MTSAVSSGIDGLIARGMAFADLRPRLAIVLVCLAALLPGFFTTPPLDRDESRYAQASRQMLETGDFVEIRYQDEARNKKPAGIYWMQTVTASLFGGAEAAPIWAYRIPSLLGAIGAALATFWVGGVLFNRRVALLGALLLGTSLLTVVEGHIAKTDAMLLFTVVLTMGVMARAYLSARRGEAKPGWGLTTLFWVSMGVGVLIKGPITPMICGLSFLALVLMDRDIKWGARLRPLTGILIMALIAAPWLLAIWIATDGAFFMEAVGNDMLGKVGSSQERHGGIPGYHLLLLSIMFFPASLFVWPALRQAWDDRRNDAVRFCIAWIIPTWLLFELTSTKLPHYVLPTYPALALLVASFVTGASAGAFPTWRKISIALFALVANLLAIASFVTPIVYGNGPVWWSLPLALLISFASFWVARAAWNAPDERTSLRGLVAGVLTMGIVFQITLPLLTDFGLSPMLAQAVERHMGPGDPATVSAGYTEPSLVFALGTDTVLIHPEAAAEHLAQTPGAVALVIGRMNERFLARAAELEMNVELREVVLGYNYSGGDRLEISVYRRTEAVGTNNEVSQ